MPASPSRPGPLEQAQAGVQSLDGDDLSGPPSTTVRRDLVSGGVYALASAAQRAVAFLLLPLYTSVLSPAEYGRLSVLLTIVGATVVILGAGLDYAVLRGYVERDADAASQRRFVFSIWALLLIATPVLAGAAGLVVLIAAPNGGVARPREIAVALLAAALSVCATTVPLAVLRAAQRLRHYLLLSGISIATNAVLTVLAVVVLRLGVLGWLLALLASAVVALAAALVVLPWSRVDPFDRPGVVQALSQGLPLVPHALSQWSLQLADRAVLATIVAPAALGAYSLGANLALPSMVLVIALNQGFLPSYARARHDPGAVQHLRVTITLHVAIVCIVGLATSLLAPPLVGLVVSSAYSGAKSVIPWITLGYVFLGLYFIPMNAVSLIAARTKRIWPMTLGAAALNLMLIYVFVPVYGVVAAGVASAAGYCALLLAISAYAAHIHVRIDIDWRRVGALIGASASVYAAGVLLLPGSGVSSLASRGSLLLGFSALLAVAAGAPLGAFRRVLRQDAAR